MNPFWRRAGFGTLVFILLASSNIGGFSQTSSLQLSYQSSLRAGGKDANGKLISGTEIMQLVPFKGRLYAGNDLWMEKDPGTPKACQILVLDSPTGEWKVDHQFTGNNLRMVAMKALQFTTDGQGKTIRPLSLLVAAPDTNARGMVELYSRDDETGTWIAMPLARADQYSTTRAIGFHHDAVTGVDLVFAGNDTLGILHGSYDTSIQGRIRWEKTPEVAVPHGERVMGFCNCNGILYCATTRCIFQRTDGASASWKQVYYCAKEINAVGIRGLTAIPNPGGPGEVLLFAALNKVRRLDPANFIETVELDMPIFLTERWGSKVSFVLAAYNDFLPYTIPATGETVWLFGFESTYPRNFIKANPDSNLRLFVVEKKQMYFAAQGRYFIRHVKDGKVSYEVAEIADPQHSTLVAVRTITASPFAGDSGALYFGAFDCNSQPSHNTAWIFRGKLETK